MENRIKERKGIRFKKRKNEERFLKARKNEGSERRRKKSSISESRLKQI